MAYRFEGTLTRTDERVTRVYPFDVPEGTTHVNVRLRYDPVHTEGATLPQQISMSVYGPTGWVAEINRPADRFEEGTDIGPDPSPGTPPSRIEAGPWKVFLSTYRIVDVIATFELDVTFRSEADVPEPPAPPAPGVPADRGPGWYRGDLHAHTWHSDGRWDSAELIAYMQDRGLDFCTLTDHNTVTGLPEHLHLANDAILTLGGSEMSTFRGHMLALGVHERVEWRGPDGTPLPVSDVAATIRDAGGMAVICHPRNVGDPWCCGCRWEHRDMLPGNAAGVEIWNGIWTERNAEGVDLWQGWLNEGHRIVATAGTDHHGMPHHMEAARVGRAAANVVHAAAFTREAILDALQRGRSYVSAGPTLRLEARDAAGRAYGMGDIVAAGTTLDVDAGWSDLKEGAWVDLVVDGERQRLGGGDSGQARRALTSDGFRWLTVEAWDDRGAWAISNPVYGAR